MIESVANGKVDTEATGVEQAKQAVCASGARELTAFRHSMRRFVDVYASLPVQTQATCPTCRRVVPATFDPVSYTHLTLPTN